MTRLAFLIAMLFSLLPAALAAQERSGPLRIEITEGVIEPVPIAVAPFLAENPAAADFAQQITAVVSADLTGTGLFRDVPRDAYISQISSFDGAVAYADWRAINVEALVTGAVTLTSDNRLIV